MTNLQEEKLLDAQEAGADITYCWDTEGSCLQYFNLRFASHVYRVCSDLSTGFNTVLAYEPGTLDKV